MKIFVTGGAGLIGSHIIERLLARGDEVLTLDNFATGRRDNLAPHPRLTLVEGSIADKALVDRLIGDQKPDAVVHTAASYKNPDDWYNDSLTNCVGGANLAQASRANRVGRFIYFQTALCYGVRPLEQPITLSHPINPANSSYAITKTTAENFLQLSGLDFVTFRLANVVGPRGVSGPPAIFYQRLSEGKKCFVTPARRDYVFVEDLADQVIRAIDGVGHGTYHFSSGKDIAIADLYDLTVRAMGLPEYVPADKRPLAEDDAPTILLDPSRTFADFGPITFTPVEEIVERTIAYYREHGVQGGYTHLRVSKD